jgi:hypothetical protein
VASPAFDYLREKSLSPLQESESFISFGPIAKSWSDEMDELDTDHYGHMGTELPEAPMSVDLDRSGCPGTELFKAPASATEVEPVIVSETTDTITSSPLNSLDEIATASAPIFQPESKELEHGIAAGSSPIPSSFGPGIGEPDVVDDSPLLESSTAASNLRLQSIRDAINLTNPHPVSANTIAGGNDKSTLEVNNDVEDSRGSHVHPLPPARISLSCSNQNRPDSVLSINSITEQNDTPVNAGEEAEFATWKERNVFDATSGHRHQRPSIDGFNIKRAAVVNDDPVSIYSSSCAGSFFDLISSDGEYGPWGWRQSRTDFRKLC